MSDTAPATDPQRYDILVVSGDRSFNTVEHGTRALMNHLIAKNIARITGESIAKEWTELYGTAGPTAHEAFTTGGFDSDLAPYLQFVLRTGKKYAPMPFGGAKKEEARFWLEFRGVLWPDLAGRFKNGLVKILATRVEILSRPHESLVQQREVAPDELPEDVKFARTDRATPRVGTAVEEF